jgi:predicted chitinase
MLILGSTGENVLKLQVKLKQIGFDPGEIDGDFGPKTEKALIDFQRKNKLQEDGIAGPKTLSILEIILLRPANATGISVIHSVTPKLVAKLFPQTPIKNIEINLPYILRALESDQLIDKHMVLMALATIRSETASFRPINEYESRYNTSGLSHPFDLYDMRSDLGNKDYPDGEKFRGRGFIQLTGRFNYTKYSNSLGLGEDLVQHPEKANDPDIAAKLLARFLKDKEAGIRRALANNDLKTARRLVNGGSHALDVFSYTYRFGYTLL